MEDKEGTITIKDGFIDIKDPEGLGRYPRVNPGENVIIQINSKKIEEETVVTSKTNILLKKKETKANKEIQLEVSDDKLKAYLTLKITPATEIKIQDSPSSNKVTIKGKVVKEEYPKITKNEIVDYLNQNSIKFGIKEEAVIELTKIKESKKVLIAEGISVKKGKNARVVPVKTKKKEIEQAFNCIDSFAKGEVIAKKIPPKPGKDGKNIYGEIIKAPQVKDIKIVTGDGVIVMQNRKAIAVKNGIPQIINKENEAIVKIAPQYILEGDIDKNTGNLKFEGDLIITGSINDYFDVKVGNNLKVKGNIANSEINASGNVLVKKNIIACNVTAGLYLRKSTFKKLNKLVTKINKLLEAINEIGAASERSDFFEENYQIGRIVRLLLNNKFKKIIPLIKEIHLELRDTSSDLTEIFSETINKLTGYKKLLKLKNIDVFIKLKEKLEETILIEENAENKSNVYTNNLQKSEINVSGDVIIKRGCYNSQIYSGNNIIVWGGRSFIKGGYYSAENYIYVKQIGSHLSPINLNIGKGFYAKEIEGTVIIKSMKDRYKIERSRKNIHLVVTDEGKIKEKLTKPNMKKIKKQLKFEFIPPVRGGEK